MYDVDNIMGLVQSENIQVHAEAYDVALDMSFPRGADGGIDFDVIRVLDEQKQQCSLKNKGKYEVAYSYVNLSNITVNFYYNDEKYKINITEHSEHNRKVSISNM